MKSMFEDIEYVKVTVYRESGEALLELPMEKGRDAWKFVHEQLRYMPPEYRIYGEVRIITGDGEVW